MQLTSWAKLASWHMCMHVAQLGSEQQASLYCGFLPRHAPTNAERLTSSSVLHIIQILAHLHTTLKVRSPCCTHTHALVGVELPLCCLSPSQGLPLPG